MKKALVLLLALAMVLSLAACGSAPAATPAEEPAAAPAAAEGEVYTVGICQLVQHAALDAATQGFKDALTEALGDKVQFRGAERLQRHPPPARTIVQPASCPTSVDLIHRKRYLAAVQAAVCRDEHHPHPRHFRHRIRRGARTLTTLTAPCGGNISGTSDLAPLDQSGRDDPGALPRCEDRSACSTAPPSRTPSTRQTAW